MDVSIIFVNYKTKDLTINAIKSVYEKTKGIDYEIFVVDNNSQDGSIEAIEQEFQNINIIKNPVNAGFGAANNLGIKESKGKYIFCLNTDTLLINNAIKIMFDFMENNPKTGACGGNLYDKDCHLLQHLSKFPKLFKYKNKIPTKFYDKEEPIAADFICGADLFLRKSVIDEIGGFDEEFFMYCEETDLCKRIYDNRYDVYLVPNAKIIHLIGSSTNKSSLYLNKVRYSSHSIYHYYRKHFGKFSVIIPRCFYVYKFLMRFIKNRNFSELKALVISQLA